MRSDHRIRREKDARALVAELAVREMRPKQVCEFLGLSQSGGRNFTTHLADKGIIRVKYLVGEGALSRRLVFCPVRGMDLEAFLADEREAEGRAAPSGAQALIKRNWFGGEV